MKDKLRFVRASTRTAPVPMLPASVGENHPSMRPPMTTKKMTATQMKSGEDFDPLRPARPRGPLRDGGVDLDPSVDDEYEEEGYQEAGDDARQKELAYRLLRHYPVDNE